MVSHVRAPLPSEDGPVSSGVRIKSVFADWEEPATAAPGWSANRPITVRARLGRGARVADKYELVRRVGSGGMSSVWEALVDDGDDCRIVALKVLSTRALGDDVAFKRFAREAKIARSLTGPGFAETYDFGVDGDVAYIAMQLLHGEDVFDRLQREQVLSPWETMALLRPLARALGSVHQRGLVHRDVKPRNIFLSKEGSRDVVKLLDFGVAQAALAEGVKLTETGLMLGSPAFMSPEQVCGERLDARSDVWSTAAVLYRCLTGAGAFDGGPDRCFERILFDQPAPVSQFPWVAPAFEALFAKAFAKDADERFQSAKELVEGFERVLLDAPLPRWVHPRGVLGPTDDGTVADVAALTR